MSRGEQRRRNVVGPARRDVGNHAAMIFVGADIVDRDLAFAEQAAQGFAGGFGQLRFLRTGALPFRRIDAAQADPRRQVEPGPQMHPRLEGVAIDGPDDVDGMPDAGISGAPPDHLGVPRRLAVGRRLRGAVAGQCSHCRSGSNVAAATPRTNTQGSTAENRRRRGFPG